MEQGQVPNNVNYNLKPEKFDAKKFIIPIVVLVIFVGAIFGIINYQRKVASSPKLEISSPTSDESTSDVQIVLEGKTNPGSKVKVNGTEVTVDSSGNFASEVSLNAGENTVSVVAENSVGKTTEVSRKITRTQNTQMATNTDVEQAAKAQTVATTGTTAQKTTSASVAKKKASKKVAVESNLSASGPENFWIPESMLVAGVGTAWIMAKEKLKKALKR